ncbi:MAG: hypothetical protein NVS4B10_16390 [Myxococcales bacterium]
MAYSQAMPAALAGAAPARGSRRIAAFLFSCLAIELVVLAASIPRHSIDVDEAWFAEEAWFQARDGFPHSNFFQGFVHECVRIVVHHWLFIRLQALVIRAVGFGLLPMRLSSIGAAVVLVALMAVLARRDKASPAELALGALILLLTPQAFRSIKLGRPDLLVAALGFASFVVLSREGPERKQAQAAFAGALAGAAMLAHLNGVIFVATGASMLLWRRRPLDAAVFAVAAGATFAPYAFDAAAHWELFREQLKNPFIAYKTQVGVLQPLWNLSREHMRLFRKPDIIFSSVLFAGCVASAWRTRPFAARYTLVLLAMLGAAVADKGLFYSVYLVPFEAVLVAAVLLRERRAIRSLVFASFSAWGLWAQATDLADKTDLVAINREIGSRLPSEAWAVTPLEMAFDELPRRKMVATLPLVRRRNGRASVADLAAYCDDKGAPYAVLYRHGASLDGFSFDGEDRGASFETIADQPRYLVLRRR